MSRAICLALVVAIGCGPTMHVRSNVVGAVVKIDGVSKCKTPGAFDVDADKPHKVTLEAEGYEPTTVTITPRPSAGLATLLIVTDILTIPIIIGIFKLVVHSARIAADPYFPGVYDQEDLSVDLKKADPPPATDVPGLEERPVEKPVATPAPAPTPKPGEPAPVPAPKTETPSAGARQPTAQPSGRRFCHSCGKELLKQGATFCSECGAKQ